MIYVDCQFLGARAAKNSNGGDWNLKVHKWTIVHTQWKKHRRDPLITNIIYISELLHLIIIYFLVLLFGLYFICFLFVQNKCIRWCVILFFFLILRIALLLKFFENFVLLVVDILFLRLLYTNRWIFSSLSDISYIVVASLGFYDMCFILFLLKVFFVV